MLRSITLENILALTFVSAGSCVTLMRLQSPMFRLILMPRYLANPVWSILNVCEMSQPTYAACVTLEMKIAGLWLSIRTATKNMSLALLTTAVSMARPKRHLKLRQSTWKIETMGRLNKALAGRLRKALSILFGLPLSLASNCRYYVCLFLCPVVTISAIIVVSNFSVIRVGAIHQLHGCFQKH